MCNLVVGVGYGLFKARICFQSLRTDDLIYIYAHNMCMKKRPLNLLVSEDLIARARKCGINLSSFLEIKLEEHLSLIHGRGNLRVKCSRRDLNPSLRLERP